MTKTLKTTRTRKVTKAKIGKKLVKATTKRSKV